ncbi:MAG: hypothetical protein HPY50_14750 [Firmicutes bacterium]|nr:hypothetical protein [Bacillota bacterium]
MSIRNVDLQVMLPKLQEVGRVQQVQQQSNQEQQQQFAAQFKHTADLQQTKVLESHKGEKGEVRDRESSRQGTPGEHHSSDRQEPENEESRPAKDERLGKMLDITI